MSASQGDFRDFDPPFPAENSPDPYTSTLSSGVARLAVVLMTELGAFLQMISSDIVRTTNLDEVSSRWSQRLMALAEMTERATGRNTAHTGRNSRSPSKFASATASATKGATHAPQKLTTRNRNQSASLTHTHPLSPRLTERESEILALARKGYRPSKIAKHLHLSVETVYTHLRNARRKQRLLDSPRSS